MKKHPCENCGKPTHNKHHCSDECRYITVAIKRKNLFLEGLWKRRGNIYQYLVERDGNICRICSLNGMWQNKPLRLRVDHIDGDATNNDPSNFRLLCPNCDSQTDTYLNRNYGKGRKSRGLPMYD